MKQTVKRNPKAPRQRPGLLPMETRLACHDEVCQGLTLEQVETEALRCLNCKHAACVDACPLHVDIKGFIASLTEGDLMTAFQSITRSNPFPGICGRVCQHEVFCEKACLLGKKREPVAIGLLERFVADHQPSPSGPMEHARRLPEGPRVALVGSGPASLMAAYELNRLGYRVTVFEALHRLGGVLSYGIPPFRLPPDVIEGEIARLDQLGVEFATNFLVGNTATIDELFDQGYKAVFLGAGAGLPYLLKIPGENLVGVYTANEFLTRTNLMRAYDFPVEGTPVIVGNRTIVIGGGNSALDAARWARRFGSETTVVFRRGRAELRARAEEVELAEQEGVRFEFLAAPVRFLGDAEGRIREVECIRMRLDKPDGSGRPSPVPIAASEYRIPVDTAIVAVGQAPNPTLQRATPQLLTRNGRIVVDELGKTNLPGVYAGGDVVRGGSTVVLAMLDGHAAALAIDRALRCEPGHGKAIAEQPEEKQR
ncbi:MAG: NADPH-dependent glutamate synthase [Bryobacterales bacterium]